MSPTAGEELSNENRFDLYCERILESAHRVRGEENYEDPLIKALYCAIVMALYDTDYDFKRLGYDCLRAGYKVLDCKTLVIAGITELAKGCDLVELLMVIYSASLPSTYTLRKLGNRWPEIRKDFIRLIRDEINSPTHEGKKKIQEIYKFWWKCLKAHMIVKGRFERESVNLIKETVKLLRKVLEEGLPDFTMNGYIRILQKVVEIVLFNTWTFEAEENSRDFRSRSQVGVLVKDTETMVNARRGQSDSEFFDSVEFKKLYMYTVIRANFGLLRDRQQWNLSIEFPIDVILHTFMPDRSLLFRAVYTLAMMEWNAYQWGIERDCLPSYWVFVYLMEEYEFDYEKLADDLIAEGTDGLRYMVHFALRVLLAEPPAEPDGSDELTFHPHPDFIGCYGSETRQLLLLLAHKLEAILDEALIHLNVNKAIHISLIIESFREAADRLH